MFVLLESMRVAWMGVAGNKLRSILTMLGVIIGVAAVIALVSVGEGARIQATGQIQALGSNLVTVSARGNAYRILQSDIDLLRVNLQGLSHIMPITTASQQTVRSEYGSYAVDIEGAGADYPFIRERNVIAGSWFTAEDAAGRRRVAVLGTTTVERLFGVAGVEPIGQTIRMLGQSYTVIGVAEPKGTGFGGQDQDDRIIVPFDALARQQGLTRIPTVIMKAASSGDSALVAQQVTDYFVAKFRSENSVRVQNQDQLLETVNSMTRLFTMLLAAIASISLAVGGIGIMNIMLVSVSERTREIGIRKAIGAKRRDVLLQFLIEALILSVSGGAVGILIGSLTATAAGGLLGFEPVVTLQSVMLSFGFSMAVGVIFGFYPAYRAAKLDPIEALRRD